VILRRTGGRPVARLDSEETRLLSLLLDDLTGLLDDESGPNDDVLQRLSPAAYRDDPEAEAEYRALTESSLRDERSGRIASCRLDLAAGGQVALSDPDTVRRWLQTLNDLRLALGTRLGVSQDTEPELDPRDPATQPWIVYSWLTAVQDAVVQAVLP
jgi:hypothetical protein